MRHRGRHGAHCRPRRQGTLPRLAVSCRPGLIATAVLLTAAGGVLVTVHFAGGGLPAGMAGRATSAPLLFLIPSSQEEAAVIRQSLVSAALVDYPDRRVVLLIDDPPDPTTPGDLHRLLASRETPRSLQAAFEGAAGPFRTALRAFRKRQNEGASEPAAEVRRLVQLHGKAASWILTHGPALAGLPSRDRSHTDRLYLKKIP
jgi:hypothetical protein